MRPKERVKERAPICEPGDPIALERCYVKEPEGWTEETLRAAVEMQRKEREGRLAKSRKVKERMKDDDGGGELGEGDGADVGGGASTPSGSAGGCDAGEGPPKRKRAPRKAAVGR